MSCSLSLVCPSMSVMLTSFLMVSTREYRSKFCRSVSMPFTIRRLAPAGRQPKSHTNSVPKHPRPTCAEQKKTTAKSELEELP